MVDEDALIAHWLGEALARGPHPRHFMFSEGTEFGDIERQTFMAQYEAWYLQDPDHYLFQRYWH